MQVNLCLKLSILRQNDKIKELEDKKLLELDDIIKNGLQVKIDALTSKRESLKTILDDKLGVIKK